MTQVICAPRIRPERDEHAADNAAHYRGDRHRGRVGAEKAAGETGQTRPERPEQHALHAQTVRARLIEEHRIERARGDAESDRRMSRRDADAERQYEAGCIAQRHAKWDVARLQFKQGAEHEAILSHAREGAALHTSFQRESKRRAEARVEPCACANAQRRCLTSICE